MANFSKRPSASGRLESAPGLSLSAPLLFGALRKIDLRIRPKALKKLISVRICLLPRFDRGDFLSIAKVTLGPLLKLKMSVEPFYLRSLSYGAPGTLFLHFFEHFVSKSVLRVVSTF